MAYKTLTEAFTDIAGKIRYICNTNSKLSPNSMANELEEIKPYSLTFSRDDNYYGFAYITKTTGIGWSSAPTTMIVDLTNLTHFPPLFVNCNVNFLLLVRDRVPVWDDEGSCLMGAYVPSEDDYEATRGLQGIDITLCKAFNSEEDYELISIDDMKENTEQWVAFFQGIINQPYNQDKFTFRAICENETHSLEVWIRKIIGGSSSAAGDSVEE